MAATPNSNYSPSPSPSPLIAIDDEANDTHTGVFSPRMVQLLTHIRQGGSVMGKAPPIHAGTQTQNIDDEANDTHTGVFSPRMVQLLTHIRQGGSVMGKAPPIHAGTQTQNIAGPAPRPGKGNKRWKNMANIRDNVKPENWATAWILVGIEVRKSVVCEVLRTDFNLKPSLAEVLGVCEEISDEYDQTKYALNGHGACGVTPARSNLNLINFMRDIMKISSLAMVRMRRVLAKCECCEKHMSRRPCIPRKKATTRL